jgi:uncharacterized protein YecT (DUF1311 family)
MVVAMWKTVYFSLGLMFIGTAMAQGPCSGDGPNGHAGQIACEIKISQRISAEVDRTFADLMKANDRFNKIPGTKPNLFTDWLKSDQAAWRNFTTKDCELQGEVTMGTAGADIEQACLKDAYEKRIQVLHQMADYLGPLSPSL